MLEDELQLAVARLHHKTDAFQVQLAEVFIRPFLTMDGVPEADRAEIQRTWAAALGVDVEWTN